MEGVCPICGDRFKVYPSSKRRYCSRKCMEVGYAERFKGEANPNFRHGVRNCEGCGKKLSRGTKGKRCVSCRNMAGIYNPFAGKKHTDGTRERMKKNHPVVKGCRNSFWGKEHSGETKRKMGDKCKRRWKSYTNEQRRKVTDALMRGIAKQRSGEYTKPEMIVAEELDKMGLDFDHNAPLYGKFFVDFLLSEGTVIEVFGDYWHGNPEVFPVLTTTQRRQRLKDKSRVAYLRKCGHRVIVLWERALNKSRGIVGEQVVKMADEQAKPWEKE